MSALGTTFLTVSLYIKANEVNLYSGKDYLRFRLIHLPVFGKKTKFFTFGVILIKFAIRIKSKGKNRIHGAFCDNS